MIYMNQTVQTFQLGSSTVVTLPKYLGIKPGQKLTIKKSKRGVLLQDKQLTGEEVEKLINKLSGTMKLKPGLTTRELKSELIRRYDDMLPGR